MIVNENRAEMKLRNALLNTARPRVKELYGTRVYQGYVAPNTISSVDRYIFIQRISATTLDKEALSHAGDTLRNVRLQVDVLDRSYSTMVEGSEEVKQAIKDLFGVDNFYPVIDSETYGTQQIGNTLRNVTSIDVFVKEKESED